MASAPAVYEHDLGNGAVLTAYSIDPKMDEVALREFVQSKDGEKGTDLRATSSAISVVGTPTLLKDVRMEGV